MISKIQGRLVALTDTAATLQVDAFEYEVLIPDFVRRQLQNQVGHDVTLHTVHYLEGNATQGKLTPRLVGFQSVVEREFFEMFCSVDGVGVRKALRSMVRPVREVAALIADQNAKGLSALPGVGPATAERIIAKLRRRMCKFALIASRQETDQTDVESDLVQETYQLLLQLGHSEPDARRLLDDTLANTKQFRDVDALLRAVYQQAHQ